jgi:hypothetical protein
LRHHPLLYAALFLRAGEPERAAAHHRTMLTKPTSAPTRRFLEPTTRPVLEPRASDPQALSPPLWDRCGQRRSRGG